MKLIESFIVLMACLFLAAPLLWADGEPLNFVSVDVADVLVITHQELRTPAWTPGTVGAWETDLLAQKWSQGYEVALLAIQDGNDPAFIKNYLEANQGSFSFVYILGEARRPDPDPITPLTPTPANFASGNIVPLYREVVDTYWRTAGGQVVQLIVESDRGYLYSVPGVSIGRMPVATRQEILDYLIKSGSYMLLGPSPSWSTRILEVANDVTSFFNGCSGDYVQAFFDSWANEFPPAWPLSLMATSTGPADPSQRALQFENALNIDHCGVIHAIGTTGDANDFVEWYYSNSPFNFTNSQYLPFLLAPSCEIAGFDGYANGVERECTVEKMLLNPNGGIIGAIAPTCATSLPMNCIYSQKFWNVVFSESKANFGKLLNRSIEVTSGTIPGGDFTLKMMVLLGDPTLNLPYGAFPEGRWTVDISPVMVNSDLTIAAGTELIVDPGVVVRFACGTQLIVNGKLVANGTQTDSIRFIPQNDNPLPGEWVGLKLNSGAACTLSYVSVGHPYNGLEMASNSTCKVSHSDIHHCDFRGINNLGGVFAMDNSRVSNCDYGGYGYINANTRIESSTFSNMSILGFWNANGSLYAKDCTFDECYYFGVRGSLTQADTLIKCTISSDRYGIAWEGTTSPYYDSCIVNNVALSGSYYGIWVRKNGATKPTVAIRNSVVSDFHQMGLRLENTSNGGGVVATRVDSCGTYAAYYFDASTPIVGGYGSPNLFDGSTYGLYLDGTSSTTVRRTKFWDNPSHGAYVKSGAWGDFGSSSGAHPDSGQNSFKCQNPGINYYDLYNGNALSVNAYYCYWGESTPNASQIVKANYKPYLASDPLPRREAPLPSLLPEDFALAVAYPNPFNPTINIKFNLSAPNYVRVKIFNILGQEVQTVFQGQKPAGESTVFWDGKNRDGEPVSTGIYFCQLNTPEKQKTIKITALK